MGFEPTTRRGLSRDVYRLPRRPSFLASLSIKGYHSLGLVVGFAFSFAVRKLFL